MFLKFNEATRRDFHQRYAGSYGVYKNLKTNTNKLVIIDNAREGSVEFSDAKGQSYSLRMDHEDHLGFEFLMPKAEWRNTEEGVFYTARRPQRQYSRGINANNTLLKNPNLYSLDINFDNLERVFMSKPIPAVEALEKFKSAALNRFLLLSSDGTLMLRLSDIGSFVRNDSGLLVKLNDDMYRQEVTDAFKRNNMEFKYV